MTSTQSRKLLEAALDFTDMGWKVLPLNGKRALIPWKELREREVDEKEVRGWFDKFGSQLTGIGLITGYVEDIAVLDLEAEEDPSRFSLPETVCVRSGGGGHHYYFSVPDSDTASANLRRHGIVGDLKCDGGYIVLPPSIHPETGKEYRWIVPMDTSKLAKLPKWIAELTKKEEWGPKDWKNIMKGATEGNRHNTTVSVAGKLLHHLPQESWEAIVLPLLNSWNEKLNQPPLPHKEVYEVFKSLAQKESARRKEGGIPGKEKVATAASSKKRTLLSVSEILNTPEDKKPNFLVDMLIPERGITALSGHPGCGKSWFMLHMAQCVATGERFLGQLKTQKGNVLIVDEESGMWEMRRRMKLLSYQEDIPIYFFCQNNFKIDNSKDLDELLSATVDKNIKLVVFDPFVAIHSKVENSAEEAQELMESLQKFNDIGVSIVFIHHHRKSGSGGAGQSLRGSSALSGRLDSHVSVEKSNETLTTTSLSIEHAKSRRGKNMPKFRVTLLQENPDSPVTLVYEEGVNERAAKKDEARNLVVELLKQGDLWTNEIVEAVQEEAAIGSRNILQAIKDLETDKLVASRREGRKKKYHLVNTHD